MSKLTPPAPQNLNKREAFFNANPEYPNAANELLKIGQLRKSQEAIIASNCKAKKDVKKADGLEFYNHMKEKYNPAAPAKDNIFQHIFKTALKRFNRGG